MTRMRQLHAPSSMSKYHCVRPDIGEGTYSQVGLYKRVVRGIGGSNLLFAVKVICDSELGRYNCPVYRAGGVVAVERVAFQLSRELQILRTLSEHCSPNIVGLVDVIKSVDRVYIVCHYGGNRCMEFDDSRGGYSATVSCWSTSVSGLCRVLCPADACECMRQLLCALLVVQQAGVCHKDIKPDNVLVNFPFQRWLQVDSTDDQSVQITPFEGYQHRRPIRITLIDFNTAEFVDKENGNQIYDAQGTVLFTPPEAFMHSQDGIDGFARDMWSAGVLGYTMLTGQLPVTGERSLEIQLKLIGLMHHDPRSVARIELPEWVDCGESPLRYLIDTLLSIDPSKRPSAKEALQILLD